MGILIYNCIHSHHKICESVVLGTYFIMSRAFETMNFLHFDNDSLW
jgi:hypothetical protein